jgi:hypothetical protein
MNGDTVMTLVELAVPQLAPAFGKAMQRQKGFLQFPAHGREAISVSGNELASLLRAAPTIAPEGRLGRLHRWPRNDRPHYPRNDLRW